MKKFISLSIIYLLFVSCGGGEDSPPPLEVKNEVPTLIAPTNNKLCLDNLVDFQWSVSSDIENPIAYLIEIAKDRGFSQIVKAIETSEKTQAILLEKGSTYYWRIKASNNKNLKSNYSTIFSFYTEAVAVINHLPFSPNLLTPIPNAVLTTSKTTLKWTAEDLDTTDILVYDVYLGTSNPPTIKIAENVALNTLEVAIAPSKEYFWKVVVKDNKGGETIGQIWKFKTN